MGKAGGREGGRVRGGEEVEWEGGRGRGGGRREEREREGGRREVREEEGGRGVREGVGGE